MAGPVNTFFCEMHMRRVSARLILAPVAALAMLALTAQEGMAQDPVRRNLLSLNPLGIPFEYISGEYEHMMTGLASYGLQGSFLSIDEGTYSTIEAKVRFYPNEEWPKGFSIGLAAGVTRLSEDRYDIGTNRDERESETLPTMAVIVDYNWILGKAKRVIVGSGVGAKRLIGASSDFINVNTAYPTARFQIGVRF
jgi:hypothetical protein